MSLDHEHDLLLMQRLKARDREALRELFHRHAPLMLGLANRILRDRHESEDCVNDVFLEVWRRADRYTAERGSPRSYLILLTRSRATDRLRRRAAREGLVNLSHLKPGNLATTTTPAVEAEASEVADIVRQELRGLSEHQQAVLELALYAGLTHQEIADATQTPLGTIKGRLRRGLLALRDRLRDRLRSSSSSSSESSHETNASGDKSASDAGGEA